MNPDTKRKVYNKVIAARGGSVESEGDPPWHKIERRALLAWHCAKPMILVQVFQPVMPSDGYFERPQLVCPACFETRKAIRPIYIGLGIALLAIFLVGAIMIYSCRSC